MKQLAQCLIDFSRDKNYASPVVTSDVAPVPKQVANDDETSLLSPPDPATAAYEKGKAEGWAKAQEKFSSERDELQAAHDEQLNKLRDQWVEEQSENINAQLNENTARMKAELADQIGRILNEVLPELLRQRAVDEVVEMIGHLPHNDDHQISIAGPQDLAAAVIAKLQATGIKAQVTGDESAELKIIYGAASIETRLQQWRNHLLGAANEPQ